jgi:hypothetical protein
VPSGSLSWSAIWDTVAISGPVLRTTMSPSTTHWTLGVAVAVRV